MVGTAQAQARMGLLNSHFPGLSTPMPWKVAIKLLICSNFEINGISFQEFQFHSLSYLSLLQSYSFVNFHLSVWNQLKAVYWSFNCEILIQRKVFYCSAGWFLSSFNWFFHWNHRGEKYSGACLAVKHITLLINLIAVTCLACGRGYQVEEAIVDTS